MISASAVDPGDVELVELPAGAQVPTVKVGIRRGGLVLRVKSLKRQIDVAEREPDPVQVRELTEILHVVDQKLTLIKRITSKHSQAEYQAYIDFCKLHGD